VTPEQHAPAVVVRAQVAAELGAVADAHLLQGLEAARGVFTTATREDRGGGQHEGSEQKRCTEFATCEFLHDLGPQGGKKTSHALHIALAGLSANTKSPWM
jgi:hypothetical protein